jgi:hypothetical protein
MKNITLVFILVSVILYILYRKYDQLETWHPYLSCPFKNWETAPSSAVYYPQIIYQKPYKWPYRFESSYPVKHYRHYGQKY